MKVMVWVRSGILLLLLCLCTVMLLSCSGQFNNNGSVTLYLPQGKLDYDNMVASEARTADPVPFALWHQQEGIEIENHEFKRSSRVSVTTIFGDSTIPLPSLTMLLPDSGLACLLDRGTCYELFGDSDAVGAKLTVEGKQYMIVGVFDWPEGMVVRQGRDGQDEVCDRITLALTGAAGKTRSADEFAMRHGISPFAAAQLGFKLDIANFIPSRWSDFEFWDTAVSQLKQQLWQMLVLPKELPQAIPMLVLLKSTAWTIAILVVLTAFVISAWDAVKTVRKK